MTTTVAPDETGATARAKAVDSDRSRAENRLGQRLVAPAVVLMLLVTAYPMLQALYLSLFRYRLTTPDDREFIWFGNYVDRAHRSAVLGRHLEHRADHGASRSPSSW